MIMPILVHHPLLHIPHESRKVMYNSNQALQKKKKNITKPPKNLIGPIKPKISSYDINHQLFA